MCLTVEHYYHVLPANRSSYSSGIRWEVRQSVLGQVRALTPVERLGRIELPSKAWKALVLPLNYSRVCCFDKSSTTTKLKASEQGELNPTLRRGRS